MTKYRDSVHIPYVGKIYFGSYMSFAIYLYAGGGHCKKGGSKMGFEYDTTLNIANMKRRFWPIPALPLCMWPPAAMKTEMRAATCPARISVLFLCGRYCIL